MSMVFGFIFGNWHRVAILLAVLGAFALWGRFSLQEHDLKETRAALAHANQMLATAQAQARVNGMATREADHTQRVNDTSRDHVSDAQNAIAAAADADNFYRVWVAGVNSVRDAAPVSA